MVKNKKRGEEMKKAYKIYVLYLLILSFIVITFSFSPNSNTPDTTVNATIDNKIVYLTFDDGPSENTTLILDILDRYDITATFFVVGPSTSYKNKLLNEIISKGHALAIHSYSHNYSQIYSNKQSYIIDFDECKNWITEVTGTSPNMYRFPGGSSTTIPDKETVKSIIIDLKLSNYYHVDWNVDSYDSHYNEDFEKIINNTINCIKNNESKNILTQTILFHDSSKKIATVNALPYIIEYLLSKGYIFKSIDSINNLIQHVKA